MRLTGWARYRTPEGEGMQCPVRIQYEIKLIFTVDPVTRVLSKVCAALIALTTLTATESGATHDTGSVSDRHTSSN